MCQDRAKSLLLFKVSHAAFRAFAYTEVARRECQKQDWKEGVTKRHKDVCGKIRSIHDLERPTGSDDTPGSVSCPETCIPRADPTFKRSQALLQQILWLQGSYESKLGVDYAVGGPLLIRKLFTDEISLQLFYEPEDRMSEVKVPDPIGQSFKALRIPILTPYGSRREAQISHRTESRFVAVAPRKYHTHGALDTAFKNGDPASVRYLYAYFTAKQGLLVVVLHTLDQLEREYGLSLPAQALVEDLLNPTVIQTSSSEELALVEMAMLREHK